MADEPTKVQSKTEKTAPAPAGRRDPLATLRDEVDRLFDDFAWRWPAGPFFGHGGGALTPPQRLPTAWPTSPPAVDIVDLDQDIQVRAELPGM